MESVNGINLNTYNMLFNSYNKHTDDNASNGTAIADISIFTSNSNDIKSSLLKKIIRLKSIRYSDKDNMYKYKTSDGNCYRFELASNFFDFLSEREKEELLSEERTGHCYKNSILLASKLSVGMVLFGTVQVEDYQYLHSVTQFMNEGRLFIVDWSHNIVMPKQDYEKLFNLKIINRVSGKDILTNYYLCCDYFSSIPFPVFLGFNYELVSRAKKLVHEKKTD